MIDAPPETWTFAPGEEIVPGRTMRSTLGGGGRCQAYLAWNVALRRRTVVKLLRPDRLGDAGARRRLRREGDALRTVGDPRVPRLLAIDVDGPRPFLELEFFPGQRLSTMLRRHGALRERAVLELGHALAGTVDVLHRRDLLHLDVKPRNVIMGPIPRLIDLSIARRFDEVAGLRRPIGTDAYMAPEQCDRARLGSIGPAADVWGIGVTMYQAVAKRLPYPRGQRGGSDHERWPQLTHDPVPPPVEVSPWLSDVLMACLARHPDARPTPAELLVGLDHLAA